MESCFHVFPGSKGGKEVASMTKVEHFLLFR